MTWKENKFEHYTYTDLQYLKFQKTEDIED